MQIKMNKSDLFGLCIVGIMAATTYVLAKRSTKQKKELEAHKREVLKDADLDKTIDDTSISNSRLSAETRAEVKDILAREKAKIDKAKTIPEFDSALSDFDILVGKFCNGTNDEIKANIIYYTKKNAREDKEAEIKRQMEADKRNADAISNSIKLLRSVTAPTNSGLSVSLSTT